MTAGNELIDELAAARVAAGLSQEAVANRMGSSASNVSRVECGHHQPGTRWLTRYAAAIGYRLTLTPTSRSTSC